MKLNLTKPIVIFDLETTGLDLVKDRIIQISYIKVYPDGKEERGNELVNPEKPIDPMISQLTGITNEDVKDKPTFKQLGHTLADKFTGCDFAGFNSNHFDIPLLAEEFLRAGVDFDFSKTDYVLCITDTKGSHADLTNEYAAVPLEMKKIASLLGYDVLRPVSFEDIIENIGMLREKAGDRAVLRAIHFVNETLRAQDEAEALKSGDLKEFLSLVKQSGDSSFKYLQNVYTNNDVTVQNVSLALAISDTVLTSEEVSRVHGGGFAGTIQAFVKKGNAKRYKKYMDKVFGDGSCEILAVRKYGGIRVI